MKRTWEEKLEGKVEAYLKDVSPTHDYYHALRVKENALMIASRVKSDKDILIAAALLHDVGYRDNLALHKLHYSYAMDLAREWLPEVGFPKVKIPAVIEAIRLHDNFAWTSDGEKTDLIEAKVIQDADRVDGFGAIGVARIAAFFGETHYPIYNPAPVGITKEVHLNHSLADQLSRQYEKFKHLNFSYSKNISRDRIEVQRDFAKRLEKDLSEYRYEK